MLRLDREHALPDLTRALERLLRRRTVGLAARALAGLGDRRGRVARRGHVRALLRELRRTLDEREPLLLCLEAIGDREERVDELLFLTEPRVQLLEADPVAGHRIELAQGA